jgi:hypothetical protein
VFSRVDSFYRAVIARGSGGRALRSRTGVHVTETQSQTVPVGCRRGTAVYSRSLLALSRMLSRLGFTTGRDTEDRHTDHRGCRISDLASRFLARRSRIGIRMPCPRVTRRPVAPCARRAARRDVEGGGGHTRSTGTRVTPRYEPHVRFYIFCAQTTTWGYIAPADSRLQRSDLRTPFSGVRRERGGGGRARRVSVRTRPNHAKFGRIEQ